MMRYLRDTGDWVRASKVFANVAGYDSEVPDSNMRTFLRDRENVAKFGGVIRQRTTAEGHDEFKLDTSTRSVRDPGLTAAEWALLSICAELVFEDDADDLVALHSGGAAAELEVAGVDRTMFSSSRDLLTPLLNAIDELRIVEFDYAKPGGGTEHRRVEPVTVMRRRGHWYLSGYDRSEREYRWSRLDRVIGDYTIGKTDNAFARHDQTPTLAEQPWQIGRAAPRAVRCAVPAEVLEIVARDVGAQFHATGETVDTDAASLAVFTVGDVRDAQLFANWVAASVHNVVVLDDDVRALLAASLDSLAALVRDA